MTFNSFVNTLVVAYVRDEFMQDEIRASGINLESLPAELTGVPTIRAYANKRKTQSHALALHDLEADIAMLERFAEPLTAIPRNIQALREKYQAAFEEYQFSKLAGQMSQNPAAGRELIRDFELSSANGVDAQTLADLSILVGHQHAQAKDKKSIVTIKGFERLSAMIGGFNPQRLGILLGGTGFGKTNAAVNLALSAAKSMVVAYANTEMGFPDMVKRFAVIASGVSYSDYASGNFCIDDVAGALKSHGQNIHLTSGRSLSFDQIAAWARIISQRTPLGMLIIDYDQKVELNIKRQMEEWKALQKLMESLEDLAKELEIYVLVLAQVNREGLISGSHRAQFPAHTVLAFYEHEIHGPILEAKKNRHGKKSQAVAVIYNESNSVLNEVETLTLSPAAKPERQKLSAVDKSNAWWGKS